MVASPCPTARPSKHRFTAWTRRPGPYSITWRAGSEYTPTSRPTAIRTPVSSKTSRATASLTDSPAST